MSEKVGDLRIWHIPQVPGKAFYVPVKQASDAPAILKALALYDLFQFQNNIKPDYCNAQGLEVYVEDASFGDEDGVPGWVEWDHEGGYDVHDAFPEEAK